MVVARLTNWVSNAETLRDRATLASIWTVGGFGMQKVLQLGSNLILTRLLFPEAFGLMTLANVILIGIQMFSDVGIKPAIVQSEHGEKEDYLNTAWTVQIIPWLYRLGCVLPHRLSSIAHLRSADPIWPDLCFGFDCGD